MFICFRDAIEYLGSWRGYATSNCGGCGVGLGLGWGFGSAFGSQYRSSRVTFQGLEFSSKGQNDEKELRDR
ncbi:hypothetical protein CK203_090030 [Vitis vinifera]|uniref:Uncharacterized protein n=1 Tax=Vitis vinifera TaxID=29760 RepID=A0A438DYD9_VITVI|nr:hypothetical protein CK203_090030 [Vitis vinifera]